jgi:5-methylcytosine-specific restriction endonuclease McrA
MIGNQMQKVTEDDLVDSDYKRFFARPGMLRRVHFPSWVQRAVFFRDRGMCVICNKDLSGIVAIGSEEHYDHIIPLALGGLNDVTNIQLLCRECNASKRDGEPATSNRYEAWYPPQ